MLENVQNANLLREAPFERFTGTFVPPKKLDKIGAGRRNNISFGDNVRDKIELTVYDLRTETPVFWQPLQDYKITTEGRILLPLYKRLREVDLQSNVEYGIRFGFRRKIIYPESLLDDIRRVPQAERLSRFRKNLGANIGYKSYIDEISRNRREVRIRPKRVGQQEFDDAFRETFVGFFNQDAEVLRYALNFGRGEVYPILNWTIDRDTFSNFPFSVVLKLQNPLSQDREADDELWVDETVFAPTFDKIVSPAEQDEGETLTFLSSPNFSVEPGSGQVSETGQKNWEDLLTGDVETTEQILANFLEEREQVRLNVDYSEFENFVKFSSAEERVRNFRYKYELLNSYNDRIEDLESADDFDDSPESQQRVEQLKEARTELVEGFDGFESFIYTKPVFRDQNGDLLPANNTAVESFFGDLLTDARRYDDQNPDALRKSLPDLYREDDRNEDFIVFVDMMGQYFDELWLYIKHIQYKSNRSEDITDPESLSQDLTKFVAESFGYELYNGFDLQDLYQYSVDDPEVRFPFADNLNTEENTGQFVQQQIWRRVLNNIPYLSKTKGSVRSIRALLNTYGIPRIGLTIREFGGGSDTDAPGFYETEDISHALSFAQDGQATVEWSGFQELPESFEVRFRTEYQGANPITIFEVSGLFSVDLAPVPGEDDVVRQVELNTATGESLLISEPVPIADGGFNVVSFDFDRMNKDARLARLQLGKIGKIGPYSFGDTDSSEGGVTWYKSTSKIFTQSFLQAYESNTNDIELGGDFLGDVDFFRTWTRTISEETFRGHVLAPARYDYDNTEFVDTRQFNLLEEGLTRRLSVALEFTTPLDLTGGAQLENRAPETNYTGTITASGFPPVSEEPWQFDRLERINRFRPVKAGADTLTSDKIRFGDTFVAGNLDPDQQREVGSFDRERKDSNKLGVYFDPQSGVNEDILSSIGIEDVNRLLADPKDRFTDEYDKLEVLNTKYWRKYEEPVDVHEYIRYVEQFNRAFFEQLENIVPARVNLKKGILMEPHILERHKFKQLGVEREEVSERTEINVLGNTDQTADYILESASENVTDAIEAVSDYVLQDYLEPVDVVLNEDRFFGNRIDATNKQTRQAPYLYPDSENTYWDPEYEVNVYISGTTNPNGSLDYKAYSGTDSNPTKDFLGNVELERIPSSDLGEFYATIDPTNADTLFPDAPSEFSNRTFVIDDPLEIGSNTVNVGTFSFKRDYESFKYERRIPFPPGEITFVNEIWESTDIFHTTFFQNFGSLTDYAFPDGTGGAYTEDDYSQITAGGDFIFTAIGRIPTPDRPYKLYRHYIFNREFRQAKKNQLYEGMVYDSSVEGKPAVELTDVEPERLIVAESDRDAGEGPIIDVQ